MHFKTQRGAGCGWIGLILFGLIFTAVGIGVGWFVGKPILDEAKASESWPSVKGTVIESELVRGRNKDGKSTYSADVIYKYTVENEEFEGDTIWFGQYSSSSRSDIQKLVKEYPVGSEIDVYYMPEDPNESVLQPGAFTSSYLVLGIGMIFAGVGIVILAIPVIKLLFFGAVFATSSSDDFVGGGTGEGDTFRDDSFRNDGFRDHRFDNDDRYNDPDDDGFGGIPGR